MNNFILKILLEIKQLIPNFNCIQFGGNPYDNNYLYKYSKKIKKSKLNYKTKLDLMILGILNYQLLLSTNNNNLFKINNIQNSIFNYNKLYGIKPNMNLSLKTDKSFAKYLVPINDSVSLSSIQITPKITPKVERTDTKAKDEAKKIEDTKRTKATEDKRAKAKAEAKQSQQTEAILIKTNTEREARQADEVRPKAQNAEAKRKAVEYASQTKATEDAAFKDANQAKAAEDAAKERVKTQAVEDAAKAKAAKDAAKEREAKRKQVQAANDATIERVQAAHDAAIERPAHDAAIERPAHDALQAQSIRKQVQAHAKAAEDAKDAAKERVKEAKRKQVQAANDATIERAANDAAIEQAQAKRKQVQAQAKLQAKQSEATVAEDAKAVTKIDIQAQAKTEVAITDKREAQSKQQQHVESIEAKSKEINLQDYQMDIYNESVYSRLTKKKLQELRILYNTKQTEFIAMIRLNSLYNDTILPICGFINIKPNYIKDVRTSLNACFISSVLNMLYTIIEFRNMIIVCDYESILQIKNIFIKMQNNQDNNPIDIYNEYIVLFGQLFNNDTLYLHQSADEFLIKIFNKIEQSTYRYITNQIQYFNDIYTSNDQNKKKVIFSSKLHYTLIFNIVSDCSLSSLIDKYQEMNTDNNQSNVISVDIYNKYIIIEILRFINNRNKTDFNVSDNDILYLCGKTYVLIGIILHLGTLENGHYKYMNINERIYTVYDDHRVEKVDEDTKRYYRSKGSIYLYKLSD